jgi:zinc/manganese transport system substrate-binding protein
MRKSLTLATSLVAVAAVGCGGDDGSSAASSGAGDSVSIVVTSSIWGDIVSTALDAVESVEVETIMPVGADPHEFAVSARQAATMEEADLVVANGGGLEAGMDDVLDSVAQTGTPVLSMVALAAAEPTEAPQAGATTGGVEVDEHAHAGDDPHVWLDPTLVITGLDALADELAERGVDGGDSIAAYVEELWTLDADISTTLGSVADDDRVLVTNHDSLEHFADRYGFEILGTVIPAATTTAEPSATDLEALAELIVERDVPAIFAETSHSDRLARTLAEEVGRDVEVVTLYTGSLGAPGSGAETYLEMMATDAALIAGALGR